MGIIRGSRAVRTGSTEVWSSDPNITRPTLAKKIVILNFFALCIVAAILFPNTSLKILQYTTAGVIILMASLRILAIVITCLQMFKGKVFQKNEAETPAGQIDWPHFTVLVPLFKEAGVVKSLMENLANLDYPQEKLDIIMVCEVDDLATCMAVEKHIRPPFKLFRVGPSEPRTKPKALNSALCTIPQSRNDDIVTIYDAEDRPHPYQLKAAAIAFMNNPQLAAVQAPLGYYNAGQNLLTRFFALEYAALFHVWNPALTCLRLPFTLGGTSNHIRRHVIEKAGGWDSHNVTEDADLSFKITALAQGGAAYKIGCIGYGTQEEAVSHVRPWIHQRSRWLKGFMQTWDVHMRRKISGPAGGSFPIRARAKNALALQITIGTTLLAAFLHVPSLCIVLGLIIADSFGMTTFTIPHSYYMLLGFGYGAAIASAIMGAIKEGKPHLIPYSFLMPFYWLLQFPAAMIAAWEFVTAPSYWRKTTHGEQEPQAMTKDKASALEPELGYPI